MLQVVEGLVNAAKKEALVLLTLYSPFMLTNNMVGAETATRHIQEDPAAFRRAIGRMTESLLRFRAGVHPAGLDGFYHSTQGGEAKRLARPGLCSTTCVRPYDLAVMGEINRACPFNILHVCDYHAPYDDLTQFRDYPGHVVNSSLDLAGKEVTRPGGGAHVQAALHGRAGAPGDHQHRGRRSRSGRRCMRRLQQAPERFILGADCTVPPQTPWDNLRLAIQIAHEAQR